MRTHVKIINQALADNGTGFLVGNELTIADLYVAAVLAVPL